ncbi:MAG TPA: hypothetical protein VEB19_10550 [Gemmatimonadaceae bacterium]|nr:hypothetical protein [Gemmatimonadaceae bacterium]
MRNSASAAILLAVLVPLANGCTRSFPTSYVAGQGVSAVTPPRAQSIAIARFEDKRSLAQRRDKNAQGFIATQSPWMFGLTHRGRKFVPVNVLIQDVFVTEFTTAGLNASPVDVESSDPSALQDAAKAAQKDFVLGGQIVAFEFVNDAGMWTVTSRRSVTLAITLLPATGDAALTNTMVTNSDAENEGMGVLHTTNIDKLMNGNFKNVVNQVIGAVATKLAMLPMDIDVRLTVVGRTYRVRPDNETIRPPA